MIQKSESEPNRWWIWPLLPFASVLGAGVGAFLFTLLQWLGLKLEGGYYEDGWYYLYILPLISAGVFGWLFSYITMYLAPKAKVITATIFVTAVGALQTYGLILMWVRYDELGENIQATVGSIAMLIAAIATIVMMKDEFSKGPTSA